MTDKEKRELHLETIITHKKYVKEMCDLMGIPELGEAHDLSKFTPEEFAQYKYVTGTGSPHEEARRQLGYSPYWCFHKNKNPHHWEYWLDSQDATPNGDGTFTMIVTPVKMPYKYVIEMFCDFVGAGKAYSKEEWTTETPFNYWMNKCEDKRAMHPTSEHLIKKLLYVLKLYDTVEDFANWYSNNKKYLMRSYEKDSKDF